MQRFDALGLCAAVLLAVSACGSSATDECADGSCEEVGAGGSAQPGSGGSAGAAQGGGGSSVTDGGAGAARTDSGADAPVTATGIGPIPAGMPKYLSVGLWAELRNSWPSQSGVPWDMRYSYFTYGWSTRSANGQYALDYMNECDSQGFMPVIQYYELRDLAGGETSELAAVQDDAKMAEYFSDFKLMMERSKDFGKPVLLLLEADGFGFIEGQAKDNRQTVAAVALTGLPELAGLPNTVMGWGLSFLQMRKSVGATNVILGMHISAWTSGGDIGAYGGNNVTQAVTGGSNFLGPMGLVPNQTGEMFDVLVGDPSDRDADFYQLVISPAQPGRWWDTSDTALITVPSFNRYAEWLKQWSQKVHKRWVLWQIPNGNSNALNIKYDRTDRSGYKDNRPEYWFAPDTGGGYATAQAHRQKFVDAGVISMLFGRGHGDCSDFTHDMWTDGQLFIKTHGGEYLKSPLALPE